ncbi:hypothetical protein SynRS9915_01023 [Synechococcus sp. RS9915]|nr:hypothetical protein SynRS9915_01023 [Synechococcus sp. RS9915]
MTCNPEKPTMTTISVISPVLPQATVSSGDMELTFDVTVVAPTRIRLERVLGAGGDAIVIDRESGEVSWEAFPIPKPMWAYEEGFGEPMECTFESL